MWPARPSERTGPGPCAATTAAVALILVASCTGVGDDSSTASPKTALASSTTTTVPPPPPLSPALAAIAERTTMTGEARDLFARSGPELVGKVDLRERCTIPEQTNVLGCFHDGRIAVLDVADPRLDGIEEATAAHELLHAVWAGLDEDSRSRLASLLRSAYAAETDESLRTKVEAYRLRDPSVVDNELHSILGTEVADLDAALEDHYAGWFTDRSTVVGLANASQAAFGTLEAQIAGLDVQLEALGREIALAEEALRGSRAAITARSDQLEVLRAAGRFDEYNAGVDPFNAAVRAYNAGVATQRQRVERYNGTVAVRNALGADHDELVAEISTSAVPATGAG